MCGINGIINLNGKIVSESKLKLMNDTIQYRGPDDQGIYVKRNVGLGHRRLSIIDLSKAGHQPMVYTHKGKSVVVVYNGEIYNFQEIKEELMDKKYKFKSKTDTEVLLAAYLE